METILESVRYSIDSQRITWQTIDDEVIIIDLELGNYYTLTGVGASIWTLIEQQATLDQIEAQMLAQFDVSTEAVRESVAVFLSQLLGENLVTVTSSDSAAPISVSAPAARMKFEVPVLEKYTDMQTLLLIDPIHEVDDKGWPHEAASS